MGNPTSATNQNTKVVFIYGLSGAGKSRAIDALEDIGFRAIDNLPIDLVEVVLPYYLEQTTHQRIAIGLEARGQKKIRDIDKVKSSVKELTDSCWLYLTCDEKVLCDRYTTTRRRHPYIDDSGELLSAIRREAHDLGQMEALADIHLDTSNWSPHYLARSLEKIFAGPEYMRTLHVTITSFGFKYGQLTPVDSLYDVRFLKNPYFDPHLQQKSGLTAEVAQFIESDDASLVFLEKLVDFYDFLLPLYYSEGKHYLRIGIGCTGGMHRSVWLAEALAKAIAAKSIPNLAVGVYHRDLQLKYLSQP